MAAELFRQGGKSPLEDEAKALPGAKSMTSILRIRQAAHPLTARVSHGNDVLIKAFTALDPDKFPLAAKDLRQDRPRVLPDFAKPEVEPAASDTVTVGGVSVGPPKDRSGQKLIATADTAE